MLKAILWSFRRKFNTFLMFFDIFPAWKPLFVKENVSSRDTQHSGIFDDDGFQGIPKFLSNGFQNPSILESNDHNFPSF